MSLAVQVEGLDKLIKDANKAGADSRVLVKAAITNSVNKIQSEARARAPHRTGTLQRSILASVSYPNGQVTVNEKYGQYIESGTGIYAGEGRITPKKALAMRWRGQGGAFVFARSTKGQKARPFFKPGIEAASAYITLQFTKALDRIAEELAGRE